MPRTVTVAALQAHYGPDMEANIAKTEGLIKKAAAKGAQIILPSELFQGIYFCGTQDARWFKTAYPVAKHPCVLRLQPLAKKLKVVLLVSIFERDGQAYYNSVVIIDADGKILGKYRKSHIPDGPGYMEKYYFRPGDTGYKVWDTKYARIGVGICWDQWYPEVARGFTLNGAEILFYPTAIGDEPSTPDADTQPQWTLVQQGHAVSNVIPVVAANRVGWEKGLDGRRHYYGSSFIANQRGELVKQMNRKDEGFISAKLDLDEADAERALWGFFRDRRTDI
jgi:N-carbamoylputrescine amidase